MMEKTHIINHLTDKIYKHVHEKFRLNLKPESGSNLQDLITNGPN